jgi:hypothetical protein
MTRQSPYAWPPRQSRAPQHAAVLRGNAVLRSRAHRAAKLFLIASVWVTGLFVVIAAVTIVAMATGPIASTSGSAALQKGLASSGRLAGDAEAGDLSNGHHDQAGDPQAGYGQAGHHQTGHIRTGESRTSSNPTRQGEALRRPATAGPSAPTRIHAVYAHTGSANTSPFTIGGDGTWKLAWAYNCTGFDPSGSFTVSQDGTGSVDGPYVTRLGTAGRGVTWAHQDAGTHYLAIRTQCQWRITVTRQP